MTDPTFGLVTPETLALFTDRYELTMLQGYLEVGHDPTVTFSCFFRELPADRGYLLATGLEQVVSYVESLAFTDRALDFLAGQGFSDDLLDYLADFTFTGDVRAVPEGTPVLPNEPILEVTAPIAQAQLFETLIINQVGFPSLVATKAARMRDVVERFGDGQRLVEFGSRRAHGTDAGVKAARAAFVGGFDGTSNEAAAEAFGVPAYGTMAHSWVQSFPTERAAFEAFVDVYGERAVLLVDTYDTVAGATLAMAVARERGVDVAGVRLDSGDLVALSKAVAPVVGDREVFVSSGVDEYAMTAFLEAGGVATGFGPGTALATSADAPTLDLVYKLVAVERDGRLAPSMKLSSGKVTYPGRKRVVRFERDGSAVDDVLGLADDDAAEDSPDWLDGDETRRDLLVDVYDGGELVYDCPPLEAVRERCRREVASLPRTVRAIESPASYPVHVSEALARTTADLRSSLKADVGRS